VADSDLTLPATLATELGVDPADARLPRLIAAASALICRYTNRRQLHYGVGISEKVKGTGRLRLVLDVGPVLSVTSVTYLDGTVVPASEYSIESSGGGLLYKASGWPLTGVSRGGLPPQNDLLAGSEASNITVVYTAGYVTPAQFTSPGWAGPARSLPYDLEEACVQLATSLYRNGGQAQNVLSESLGDYSVTYADRNAVGWLTAPVRELLIGYLRPEG
jgi:hypothetical protein